MSQSLSRVVVHIVFSTKNRKTWLSELAVRTELHKYLAKTLQTLDCPAIIVGGHHDHIHALCNLSRNIAIRDLMQELKTASSKEMKTKGIDYQDFYWQNGYGIFSVSESNVEEVRKYIENQEEHHKCMTFQDEFRLLCKRHGIEFDERYVWD